MAKRLFGGLSYESCNLWFLFRVFGSINFDFMLKELLQGFDWFYEYSDSYQVWKKGADQYNKILVFLKHNPSYQEEFEKAKKLNMGNLSINSF